MGPPPPEPAPRSQSEVNTGRPWGWTGAGSCRGRVGVTGRRRAGERARGDGRADKVSESARPRRRSAHGGKLKPLLEAEKLRRGGPPFPLATPRGRPRFGRRRLAVGTPSHFLLVAYPPPAASAGAARTRPGVLGEWVEARGSATGSLHVHPLPPGKRVLLGFRALPDPRARLTWETLLLSVASKPACETKLYCAVTSRSARLGKCRRF